MARLTLICCEGKTEKEYFEILRRSVFRIPGYVDIRIEGEKGQHMVLVDRVVELRRELACQEDLPEDEIECWAVCDDDNMPVPFARLSKYAEEQGVHLAFSRPQFESYLLQHFEPSKEVRQKVLYEKLGTSMGKYGDGEYDKADLRWLENMLIDNPKLVDVAVVNADLRRTQSASPFLTVQDLTRRLMGMRRY